MTITNLPLPYDQDFTTSRKRAKEIAADWHSGQGSPLYAYQSTGVIMPDLLDDIRSLVNVDRLGNDEVGIKFNDLTRLYDRVLADLRAMVDPVHGGGDTPCAWCRTNWQHLPSVRDSSRQASVRVLDHKDDCAYIITLDTFEHYSNERGE